MIGKNKTVAIKRAREAKEWRNYYFGIYLLKEELGVAFLDGSKERIKLSGEF